MATTSGLKNNIIQLSTPRAFNNNSLYKRTFNSNSLYRRAFNNKLYILTIYKLYAIIITIT